MADIEKLISLLLPPPQKGQRWRVGLPRLSSGGRMPSSCPTLSARTVRLAPGSELRWPAVPMCCGCCNPGWLPCLSAGHIVLVCLLLVVAVIRGAEVHHAAKCAPRGGALLALPWHSDRTMREQLPGAAAQGEMEWEGRAQDRRGLGGDPWTGQASCCSLVTRPFVHACCALEELLALILAPLLLQPLLVGKTPLCMAAILVILVKRK